MYKNDPMKAYMQDIGEIPLISKDEEIVLAARIKRGDEQARQKLIKSNLRLVVKIAHDFKGLGLPLLDLISEGNIGLMRAAEKFDPAKGAKFSSYSAWWIKQSMRRALSQKSRTIRVPVASAGKITKIRSARVQLGESLGRQPTDTEIAEHLDLTRRTVQGLKLADLKTFSLHDPIQKGEDGNFEDIIPDTGAATPDEIIEDNESIQSLRRLIHRLDERERTILVMRYGLDGNRPKTLEEVSKTIGRTRERVRQIQMQALKKLRTLIDEEGMEGSHLDASDTAGISGLQMELTLGDQSPLGTRLHRAQRLPPRRLIDGRLEDTQVSRYLKLCDDPVSQLRISRRSLNSLRSVGINSVADLANTPVQVLMDIRYFGEKCLLEVQEALDSYYADRMPEEERSRLG